MASRQTLIPKGASDSTQGQPIIRACQNFAIGVVFTGLPIFLCVSLSLEMTHTPWVQVGQVRRLMISGIPLICGVMAVVYGRRFTTPLSNFFESLNLPF